MLLSWKEAEGEKLTSQWLYVRDLFETPLVLAHKGQGKMSKA